MKKTESQCRWKRCRREGTVGWQTKSRGDIYLCDRHSNKVFSWESISWKEKKKRILNHTK